MRALWIIPCLLVAWLTLAAGSMLIADDIRTAMVPIGGSMLMADLPENIAIIDKRGPILVLYSDDPDYVAQLYKAGAKLILPARKKTCLDLQVL